MKKGFFDHLIDVKTVYLDETVFSHRSNIKSGQRTTDFVMQQQVRTPHGRTAITTAAIMTKTKAASIQSIRSLKKVGQALKWLNHWIHCQTN
jgi:hypothetical protein